MHHGECSTVCCGTHAPAAGHGGPVAACMPIHSLADQCMRAPGLHKPCARAGPVMTPPPWPAPPGALTPGHAQNTPQASVPACAGPPPEPPQHAAAPPHLPPPPQPPPGMPPLHAAQQYPWAHSPHVHSRDGQSQQGAHQPMGSHGSNLYQSIDSRAESVTSAIPVQVVSVHFLQCCNRAVVCSLIAAGSAGHGALLATATFCVQHS